MIRLYTYLILQAIEFIQSVYCVGHSYKTVLLKVKTDILHMMENCEVICLVMLDLSAAFDTVCHSLFLNRLQYHFGIEGKILQWIKDYLVQQTQWVIIQGEDGSSATSDTVELKQGVPQGSVCGPVLFTLYISHLGDICRKHKVNFHSYADDQQNYLSFWPTDKTAKAESMARLHAGITDMRCWMWTNLLKLNDSKTEFVVMGMR